MRYVQGDNRRKLATMLNLNERQVTLWFKNRRAKEKRLNETSENVEMVRKSPSPLSKLQSFSSSSLNASPSPSQSILIQTRTIPLENRIYQTIDYQSIAQENRMPYKYIPEWEPLKQTTSIYHPMHETEVVIPPDQFAVTEDIQPIKMEPIDEDQNISVDENAQHYEFVEMQNENDGQKSIYFTATKFDEYKKQCQQKRPFGQPNSGSELSSNNSNSILVALPINSEVNSPVGARVEYGDA